MQRDTPLTIGVFGAWRYTRTESLWRALLLAVVEGVRRYVLDDEQRLQQFVERGTRINPNAPPDAKTTLKEQAETRMDDLVTSLYRSVEREETGKVEIDWSEAGKLVTRLGVRLGFSFIPLLAPLTQAVEQAQQTLGEGEDVSTLFDTFQRKQTFYDRAIPGHK